MKRFYTIALFIVLAAAAGNLRAQAPLFEEFFSYTAGSVLTANGWTAHSVGGTNAQTIVTPGLTYAGYAGNGVGNAVRLISFGEDNNKMFTDSASSGSVYVGFLVRVDTAKTGDYFIHLGPKTIGTTFRMRVYVKTALNNNLAFGLSKSSVTATTPTKYTDSIYTLGTTYLIVAKYTIVAGDLNDSVALWVNPQLSAGEPAPQIVHTDAATTASDIYPGSVALRQGALASASSVVVDGIRVVKSWAALAPIGVNDDYITPAGYGLGRNYPNPFNPSTVIRFTLPAEKFVTLNVYNILGKEVATVVNGYLGAGEHQVTFDATGLQSGVYFYTMNAGNGEFTRTGKMTLLK